MKYFRAQLAKRAKSRRCLPPDLLLMPANRARPNPLRNWKFRHDLRVRAGAESRLSAPEPRIADAAETGAGVTAPSATPLELERDPGCRGVVGIERVAQVDHRPLADAQQTLLRAIQIGAEQHHC